MSVIPRSAISRTRSSVFACISAAARVVILQKSVLYLPSQVNQTLVFVGRCDVAPIRTSIVFFQHPARFT